MALSLFDDLAKYFKKKDINEDNFACNLVHRGTVAFLLVATGLVAANTVFGDAIKCNKPKGHNELSEGFIENFCWVHGAHHFPSNTDIVKQTLRKTCYKEHGDDDVSKIFYKHFVRN